MISKHLKSGLFTYFNASLNLNSYLLLNLTIECVLSMFCAIEINLKILESEHGHLVKAISIF